MTLRLAHAMLLSVMCMLRIQTDESYSIFSAFSVPSFRFQFSADLLVAWAIEMEVLILAWYVLVATDSPLAVAVLGALRFGGTLLSPFVGGIADRFSRKRILLGLRAGFSLAAITLMTLGLSDWLAPWQAFVLVGFTGLLRPVDMMLRQSLIADSLPRELLTGAMSFSRMTLDSARMVGALAGAGLMASLGIGKAYVVVSIFYVLSTLLSFGIRPITNSSTAAAEPLLDQLKAGIEVMARTPAIRYTLGLAFLVNLTALSISGGLLPIVARDVYGLDSTGLGAMVATFAGGALAGSLITVGVARYARPERIMLFSAVLWHVLLGCFAFVQTAEVGIPLLGLIGFVSSFTMVPMSSSLLLAIPVAFRARIMGIRQLAVFGLPLGLLASGYLIEAFGVDVSFASFAVIGIVASVWIAWDWHREEHA